MSIKGNSSNVNFDFDGALALARQLWQLADTVADVNNRRQSSTTDALVNFSGQYADQFMSRENDEAGDASRIGNGLHGDANACAQLWKDAMDEQNRRLYAQHVDHLKSNRSNMQKVHDFFSGFDYPPKPTGVPLPHGPAFSPTATLVKYSS